MSEGRLIQHQQNAHFIHNIETYDDKVLPITSTHHQAQYPYNLPLSDYKVLAWTKGISSYHKNGKDQEVFLRFNKECEIVYYKKTDVLGIQGHPEMMKEELYADTLNYLRRLLVKYMSGFLKESNLNEK